MIFSAVILPGIRKIYDKKSLKKLYLHLYGLAKALGGVGGFPRIATDN